jgi:hypothetical protein
MAAVLKKKRQRSQAKQPHNNIQRYPYRSAAAYRNNKHIDNTMRFLHLIRPVMCVLPEVASPDRKVRELWKQRSVIGVCFFSTLIFILRVESLYNG